MKLEVGKKYTSKSGDTVEIVGKYSLHVGFRQPYVGICRTAEGLIQYMCHYSEDGQSECITPDHDLKPRFKRHERWYGLFQKKEQPEQVIFAYAATEEGWRTLKTQLSVRHNLLKEGYDFVEVEE